MNGIVKYAMKLSNNNMNDERNEWKNEKKKNRFWRRIMNNEVEKIISFFGFYFLCFLTFLSLCVVQIFGVSKAKGLCGYDNGFRLLGEKKNRKNKTFFSLFIIILNRQLSIPIADKLVCINYKLWEHHLDHFIHMGDTKSIHRTRNFLLSSFEHCVHWNCRHSVVISFCFI